MSGGRVEDGWEFYQATADEVEVHLAAGEVVQARYAVQSGAAARVVRGGRLGAATATGEFDRSGLLERAGLAADISGAAGFKFPTAAAAAPVDVCDPEVAALGAEELAGIALGFDAQYRGLTGRPLVSAMVRRTSTAVAIENSSGCAGAYRRTVLEARLGAGDNVRIAGQSTDRAVCRARLAERLAERATAAGSSERAPEGRVAVLFAEAAAARLLEPLVANLDGMAFASGASVFAGDGAGAGEAGGGAGEAGAGAARFRPDFWLWEDGTLAGFTGSAPFDAEGVPTRRNVLIEAGRRAGLLLDCAVAARLGVKPVGMAVRDEFPGLPVPGLNNLEMAAGTEPLARLIGAVERGLVVYDLILENDAPRAGLAAQVSSGLLVRHGRACGRVDNAMIQLNVFDAFASPTTQFSRERERVDGTLLLPAVLVQGVAVARG